jgi:hypothetical protein
MDQILQLGLKVWFTKQRLNDQNVGGGSLKRACSFPSMFIAASVKRPEIRDSLLSVSSRLVLMRFHRRQPLRNRFVTALCVEIRKTS